MSKMPKLPLFVEPILLSAFDCDIRVQFFSPPPLSNLHEVSPLLFPPLCFLTDAIPFFYEEWIFHIPFFFCLTLPHRLSDVMERKVVYPFFSPARSQNTGLPL